MCSCSARSQRLIVEECLKFVVFLHICVPPVSDGLFPCRWISQRKAFGKPLSSQAVIRNKMAGMISRAEACQAWLENVTYQMCNMVRVLPFATGYLLVYFYI
jgi:hypothetical protein